MWFKPKENQQRDIYSANYAAQELLKTLKEIKRDLAEIQLVMSDISVKASVSHSLLVIRKIAEDKVDEMEQLLD